MTTPEDEEAARKLAEKIWREEAEKKSDDD